MRKNCGKKKIKKGSLVSETLGETEYEGSVENIGGTEVEVDCFIDDDLNDKSIIKRVILF